MRRVKLGISNRVKVSRMEMAIQPLAFLICFIMGPDEDKNGFTIVILEVENYP